MTELVREALAGVRCALIEANHDVQMLLDGPYPPLLKRRVLSERGHLSNDDCAALAVYLAENGAESIILGHLSRENNSPGLALSTVGGALSRAGLDNRYTYTLRWARRAPHTSRDARHKFCFRWEDEGAAL